MASRGKKTPAETEDAIPATETPEADAQVPDPSADPAETTTTDLDALVNTDAEDEVVKAAAIAEVITPPAEAVEAEAGAADASAEVITPTAEAIETMTDGANQALDAILSQADAPSARRRDPPDVAPERRWFTVADPVTFDSLDYGVGDEIALTFAVHADLLKAGAVIAPWMSGDIDA